MLITITWHMKIEWTEAAWQRAGETARHGRHLTSSNAPNTQCDIVHLTTNDEWVKRMHMRRFNKTIHCTTPATLESLIKILWRKHILAHSLRWLVIGEIAYTELKQKEEKNGKCQRVFFLNSFVLQPIFKQSDGAVIAVWNRKLRAGGRAPINCGWKKSRSYQMNLLHFFISSSTNEITRSNYKGTLR